jgi:hypothetical protein
MWNNYWKFSYKIKKLTNEIESKLNVQESILSNRFDYDKLLFHKGDFITQIIIKTFLHITIHYICFFNCDIFVYFWIILNPNTAFINQWFWITIYIINIFCRLRYFYKLIIINNQILKKKFMINYIFKIMKLFSFILFEIFIRKW